MRRLASLVLVSLVSTCLVHAEPITAVSGVFTVDMTPPTAPQAVAPGDGASVTAPFLRLQASSTDALTGVVGYEFQLLGEYRDLDTSYTVFRGLVDGSYTWTVRARDAAGNLSDWSSFTCGFAGGDDTDLDGLPDAWEMLCFGNLTFTDGSKDSDQDGVSDLLEAEADTHAFEFYVDLLPGWNMIALPCDTTVDSAAALIAASAGPVWAWDAANLRYSFATEPKAYQGMWLFSDEEITGIPVSGTPPVDNVLRLRRGWNLVGSGLPATLDSTDGIGDILSWSDDAYTLTDPEELVFDFLQGYWVYVSLGGDRQLLFVE